MILIVLVFTLVDVVVCHGLLALIALVVMPLALEDGAIGPSHDSITIALI